MHAFCSNLAGLFVGTLPIFGTMNGLIGYGSSDDEEGDAKEDAPSTAVTVDLPSQTANPSDGSPLKDTHPSLPSLQHAVNNDAVDGILMVGPTMPTDLGVMSQVYDEDDRIELPQMPERDLLRYLTQPTHPTNTLPPEPVTAADPSVTAKLKKFIELKSKGIHFNEDLAGKTSFRNPNLFASLLERAGLSPEAQYTSALHPDVLSMSSLPPWAYKEALHEKQKSLTADYVSARKAQSAAGKRTIDFIPPSQESTPGIPKRKRT